jgi:hypothetical protein
MEQVFIYTAITGGKDKPREDIKCFTKNICFDRPVIAAKVYKILSHLFIDTDISIWVDGNIKLLIPKEELVAQWLGDADIAVWKHFDRDCIYEEAQAAKGLGGDYTKMIDEQIEEYKNKGFPRHAGLAECNVIIRRHNDKVKAFNEDWWDEILKWSCRDQISFPVVLARHDLKVNFVEGNVRKHDWFEYTPH